MKVDKQRCTGTVKRTGKRCARYPTHGATVCRSHGAGAPQVRRRAAERVMEQRLLAAAVKMDVVPIGDPLNALQSLAGEVTAWKELLAGRVAALSEIRYASPAGEQLRAEVQLWERALDRCAAVLATIAKLNIDDRLARIKERQADLIVTAILSSLTDIGLTEDQTREAKPLVATRLRAITSS